MFSAFTSKPDFTPYTARPNQIALNEMNPPLAGLTGLQLEMAKFSLTVDSSEPDSAPADLMNRAIWLLNPAQIHCGSAHLARAKVPGLSPPPPSLAR